MALKTCSCCDKKKPTGEFHIDRSAWDGRRARCKQCTNEWKYRGPGAHREQDKPLSTAIDNYLFTPVAREYMRRSAPPRSR